MPYIRGLTVILNTIHNTTYWWFCTKLGYLQCINNGDIAVLTPNHTYNDTNSTFVGPNRIRQSRIQPNTTWPNPVINNSTHVTILLFTIAHKLQAISQTTTPLNTTQSILSPSLHKSHNHLMHSSVCDENTVIQMSYGKSRQKGHWNNCLIMTGSTEYCHLCSI